MRSSHKGILVYSVILLSALISAHFGSQTVTVLAENRPVRRSMTVVIDPGHGGLDGGAISCTGIPESRFNLEISLRLNEILRLLGYKTLMIRKEDISVYTEGETVAQKKISDLKQRVQMVEHAENPILLSIHQNYFPQSQYSGAQVFYAATPTSRDLANVLQTAFNRYLKPVSPRQEKKSSGIYLMEHISCPAVLIECGFLSNPGEEALLQKPDYQKKISALISCSVAEYLSNT